MSNSNVNNLIYIFINILIISFFIIFVIDNYYISNKVVVVIDYGNREVRKFGGSIDSQINARDALYQSAYIGNINIVPDKNFFPVIIGDLESSIKDKKWVLYINNNKINNKIIENFLQDGDTMTIKFE